jgi:hypothetical protein
VSFRYNTDPSNTPQYGLVAEEVAKSYPELVSYGADGKPQTVRYLELSAMLLNDLQKQSQRLEKQTAENQRQAKELRRLPGQVSELSANLTALIKAMLTRDAKRKLADASKAGEPALARASASVAFRFRHRPRQDGRSKAMSAQYFT